MRRSVFWQATCFYLVEWRSDMAEAALRAETDRRLEAFDYQSATRKLQDVLSLRMSSFYRCAFRLLGNAADAEDAVQEAFSSAYKHINQFRGQSQISTWLTTIVRNCALMQLRKRPHRIHCSLDEQFGKKHPRSLGRTRRRAARPGREASKIRINRALARMHRTAIAYLAKNISAACRGWSLNL
jgi:RNA polymerase sigma factor (sigma-70 family)